MLLFVKVIFLSLTWKGLLEAPKKQKRILFNDLNLKLHKKVKTDYYESTLFLFSSNHHQHLLAVKYDF